MPVREAFHRLVAEQALENRPNRTIGLPTLTPIEFQELTEIRVQLEGLAAQKAALSITEKERNRIRAIQAKLETLTAQSGRSAYLDFNRKFHFAIYEASRSENLVRLIDQLWLRVGPLLNWSASRRENILGSRECHRAAIAALDKGDAVAARDAIVKDIEDAAAIVRGEMVEEIEASSKAGTA
jgi:DNA-binding GntR family transcriptional regulator